MDTYQSPALYSVDFAQCGHLAAFRGDEIADLFAAALRRAGATIVKGGCHDFPGAGRPCVLLRRGTTGVLHTGAGTGPVEHGIFACPPRGKDREAVGDLSRS